MCSGSVLCMIILDIIHNKLLGVESFEELLLVLQYMCTLLSFTTQHGLLGVLCMHCESIT